MIKSKARHSAILIVFTLSFLNVNVQFTNWTTPLASLQLLKKFDEHKILSKDSHAFLSLIQRNLINQMKKSFQILPKLRGIIIRIKSNR